MNTDYDNFQLDWMMEHDHSIDDIITAIDERDEYKSVGLSDAYRQWVADGGFQDDGIWPSEDEFLYSEFHYSEYDHVSESPATSRPIPHSPSVIYYKDEDGILHLSDTRRDGYTAFATDNLSRRWPWIGRSSIDIVRIEDKITLPPNSSGLFADLANLTSIDGLANLDTSIVTDMSRMFDGCHDIESLDLSTFDTSNVANMSHMFLGCSSLASIEGLSGWDTGNVTNMSHMFHDCKPLESLDVGGWDTSKVTDMLRMFAYCKSLESLDLGSWDTSRVMDMSWMFYNCPSFTSLDLSGWNTSYVTNMSHMFHGCKSIESLDLRSWDTSHVRNMEGMFAYTPLQSLDLSGWDTSKVWNMSIMFAFCTSLRSLDLLNLDTSKVWNMSEMFAACNSLETVTTEAERIPRIVPFRTKVVEPTTDAGRDATPSLGVAIGQATSACRAADEGHTGHSGHDPR